MEQQNCLEESGIRRTTPTRDQLARSEDLSGDHQGSFGQVSINRRSKRWRRSPQRFFVNRRGFYLSSSRWTSSSALLAERRNIPNLHWHTLTWPGLHKQTCCKKAVLTIIGKSTWIEVCQIHGQDSRSSQHGMKSIKKGFLWFREAAYKKSSNYQMVWHVNKQLHEQQWAFDEPKLSEHRENWEASTFIWSGWWKVQGNHEQNARKKLDMPMEAAMPCTQRTTEASQQAAGSRKGNHRIQQNPKHKACMHRRGSWICEKAFGIYCTKGSGRSHRGERFNSVSHYNLVHKFHSYTPSDENPRCETQRWTKNGRSSKSCWRGKMIMVKSKKEVILEAQKEKRKVHFASLMDICHLKKYGVGTEVSKVRRLGCAPRWHCERRFRLVCCIHRARFVCVTHDGRKGNVCHGETTRLCRTSIRRSIRLRSSKNGGRSEIVWKLQSQNVQIFGTSLLLTRKLCCMWFEDNEAVIKMIIEGRSPTMRHVSRTHRVALDWFVWKSHFEPQNPNHICWHQGPTCWHVDQR